MIEKIYCISIVIDNDHLKVISY